MSRYSSNAVLKESFESHPEVQIRTLEEKEVAVRQALVETPPKNVAHPLEVTEQTVNKWKRGDAPIPADRHRAILQAHLAWGLERLPNLIKTMQVLSDELSRIYGPRNGHASRGDF